MPFGLDKLKADYDEFVNKKARESLLAGVKELFTAFPEIRRIGWKGYLPSWNDGDTCEFSIQVVAYETFDPRAAEKEAAEKALVITKRETQLKIHEAENEVRRLKGLAPLPTPKENVLKKLNQSDDDLYSWFDDNASADLKKAFSEFDRSLYKLQQLIHVLFGDNHIVIINNDADMTMTVSEYDAD